mmetsp:Transcript_3454/g.21688  ORF Transcript_3454/g.21688 Transcript_3454/m.21688 type:complete len:243 (+) Transcript_3454:243-971(+)
MANGFSWVAKRTWSVLLVHRGRASCRCVRCRSLPTRHCRRTHTCCTTWRTWSSTQSTWRGTPWHVSPAKACRENSTSTSHAWPTTRADTCAGACCGWKSWDAATATWMRTMGSGRAPSPPRTTSWRGWRWCPWCKRRVAWMQDRVWRPGWSDMATIAALKWSGRSPRKRKHTCMWVWSGSNSSASRKVSIPRPNGENWWNNMLQACSKDPTNTKLDKRLAYRETGTIVPFQRERHLLLTPIQ